MLKTLKNKIYSYFKNRHYIVALNLSEDEVNKNGKTFILLEVKKLKEPIFIYQKIELAKGQTKVEGRFYIRQGGPGPSNKELTDYEKMEYINKHFSNL